MKLAAIHAFGIGLDPDMCRLHIDGDPDVAHIPRKKKFVRSEEKSTIGAR